MTRLNPAGSARLMDYYSLNTSLGGFHLHQLERVEPSSGKARGKVCLRWDFACLSVSHTIYLWECKNYTFWKVLATKFVIRWGEVGSTESSMIQSKWDGILTSWGLTLTIFKNLAVLYTIHQQHKQQYHIYGIYKIINVCPLSKAFYHRSDN